MTSPPFTLPALTAPALHLSSTIFRKALRSATEEGMSEIFTNYLCFFFHSDAGASSPGYTETGSIYIGHTRVVASLPVVPFGVLKFAEPPELPLCASLRSSTRENGLKPEILVGCVCVLLSQPKYAVCSTVSGCVAEARGGNRERVGWAGSCAGEPTFFNFMKTYL
jgi:hypothetical protein